MYTLCEICWSKQDSWENVILSQCIVKMMWHLLTIHNVLGIVHSKEGRCGLLPLGISDLMKSRQRFPTVVHLRKRKISTNPTNCFPSHPQNFKRHNRGHHMPDWVWATSSDSRGVKFSVVAKLQWFWVRLGLSFAPSSPGLCKWRRYRCSPFPLPHRKGSGRDVRICLIQAREISLEGNFLPECCSRHQPQLLLNGGHVNLLYLLTAASYGHFKHNPESV